MVWENVEDDSTRLVGGVLVLCAYALLHHKSDISDPHLPSLQTKAAPAAKKRGTSKFGKRDLQERPLNSSCGFIHLLKQPTFWNTIMANLDGDPPAHTSSPTNNISSPLEVPGADPAAQPCPLLDKLPPELRSTIYDFVVASRTTEARESDMIDLTKHTPPDKALLVTCRQIYNEAKKVYVTAYRAYWTDNRFRFYRAQSIGPREVKIITCSLRERDLQHIRHLELVRDEPSQPLGSCYETYAFRLVDARGLWLSKYAGEHFVLCQMQGHVDLATGSAKKLAGLLPTAKCGMSLQHQIVYLLRTTEEFVAAPSPQVASLGLSQVLDE